MKNAVCCEDKRHCCPQGTKCDLEHSMCVSATYGPSPLWRKFAARRRKPSERTAVVPSTDSSDIRNVICPDKISTCPDDTTCCKLETGSYGCCPMPKAVCCSDHLHCCPEATTCDPVHSMCVSANGVMVKMASKIPATSLKQEEKLVPCNETVACASGTTCCKTQEGTWACCPLLKAVCCEDHAHCCPQDTVCNLTAGTCDDPADLSVAAPWMAKVPTFPIASPNQKCDETTSCPDGSTCCRLSSEKWGCCPLPQAVCCEDHLHCCPHDTVCNLAASTCDSSNDQGPRFSVPLVKKTAAVTLPSQNQNCDETSLCPAGTTCCRLTSGSWACCPMPQAVCCADQEHCCPQGYKCDLTLKTCVLPGLPSMPWFRKQSAQKQSDDHTPVDRRMCDNKTSCPEDDTCCFMHNLGKWGCCPLPKAVCCKDGDHCCPSGYKCNEKKTTCTKAYHEIPCIAATAGSRLNADRFGSLLDDFDSTCIYTDWERRPGSNETDQGYSPAEAEWSSDSSCYTADCDSYCTTDRQTSSSDSDGCRLEALSDIKCPEVFLPGSEGCCDAAEAVCRDTVSDPESFCSRRDTGELCGVVTQMDRQHFSEFFCEMIKEVTQEKDTEKMNVNEGFLFHPKKFLQVKNSEYREGREYSFLRHIQNGSYGDVFSIRDKQTGFTCAAKKIPLCSFRWEEVETWSRMESPRVLQLYGAVKEGPNVILFMDLKTGSLAQLLRVKGCLSEELALYYHSQVLQALQHLHSRRVVHLDVKVDNVLLSEDGRQCFLCDFGLSETLNQGGYSTKTFRGSILRGTESHMPPEVARGDPRSAKADIWSSCCMLLHMLNGHQPWTRYYPHPLYLKIVSEPPPLWEIPPDCDPLTCDVIKGGLVKEPRERHSASELLQKTVKALRTVCGLSGSEEPSKQYSAPVLEDCPNVNLHETPVLSIVESPVKTHPQSFPEDLSAPTIHWVSTWRQTAPNEDDSDSTTEESEWDEDADINKLKRDKMSSWMDRYWGEEEDNEKQICSEDDRELESDEDTPQINEIVNATDAEESKTVYFTEKRVVFGGCGEYDRSLLEESESWDGEIRSVVDDEEVESDLESLRELASDCAQEWEPFLQLQTLYCPKEAQLQSEDSYSESEEESVMLRKSEQKDTSLPDSHGPQPLTCTSFFYSEQDLSDEDPDDLSSGVFSSCSTTDGHSFNVDWSVSTDQTPSCYFEGKFNQYSAISGLGVDVWVEDVSGESLKIRERPQVKIGHIAVGISEQISLRTFSLATLDGRLVSPDTEVCESGMWLQCVPAPDGSLSWDWRVRDGKLELREYDEHPDTCSTVALEQN
ncbi:hypothetical protein cypCar_00026215 [Cyprinus carpio]|nr:hypothetical protein cypCar_00026215 [Cyprinus carpio]